MTRISNKKIKDLLKAGDKFLVSDQDTGIAENVSTAQLEGYIIGVKGDRKVPIERQVDFTTAEPPRVNAERFINTVTGISSNNGLDVIANYIYEARGGYWEAIAAVEGFTVWDKELKRNLYFNGTDWIIEVSQSGITTNRPLSNLSIGLMFFDTTLQKPIWYNGSNWVDSTGGAV